MVLAIVLTLFFSGCTGKESSFEEKIIGKWVINYAEHVDTKENYPLQEIYGTGIEYGGFIEISKDGTFSKLIGVTNDEDKNCGGTYKIEGKNIYFVFENGKEEKAVYLREENEIRYENSSVNAYEYFVSFAY